MDNTEEVRIAIVIFHIQSELGQDQDERCIIGLYYTKY